MAWLEMFRLKNKLLVILLLFLQVSFCDELSFFEDHERGWFWGERSETKRVDLEPESKTQISINVSDDALVKHTENVSKEAERLLKVAWANPTPRNLERFLRINMYVLNQSAKFSDSWHYVLANTPELDPTVDFPMSNVGGRSYDLEQEKIKTATLKSLAKTHGLMFFYSSRCSNCRTMATIVKRFAKKYSWYIKAISIDGGGLPEFSDFVLDNGGAEQLGITHLPALIAVGEEKKPLVLAVGIRALSDIEDTAMKLVEYLSSEVRHG